MSRLTKGGPAFPFVDKNESADIEQSFFEAGALMPGSSMKFCGMSLRDYFASKAMQGFAVDADRTWDCGTDGMAKAAYRWADAMLKARAA